MSEQIGYTPEEAMAEAERMQAKVPGRGEATTEDYERANKAVDAANEMASQLHEQWRASRKLENGQFDPRVKVEYVTDDGKEKWVNEGKLPEGADEVKRQDIANTEFKDLDPYWQAENLAAADVAVGEVSKTMEKGAALDDKFIEEASAVVHEKWLERNQWVLDPQYGNPDQAKPYAELSENEKEKDRVQIRQAIEIMGKTKK